MPTIYVIAGPNGVGKTTFADTYLPDFINELEFVNADLIAKGLSPYDPDSAVIEAGRITLQRIRQFISERRSFTWETTMSGRSAAAWLADARAKGYTVKCYFLWVRDVETTIHRIQRRVVQGGHNIEPEVSRRRFYKTLQNFFQIYRPVFDSWRLFENDGLAPRLIAIEKAGRLAIRDPKQFEKLIAEVGVNI
jgi:predicted ABC-type ATPase